METRHLLAVTKIAHGLYGAIVFTIFDSRSGNQPQACPTREHSSPGKHFGRLISLNRTEAWAGGGESESDGGRWGVAGRGRFIISQPLTNLKDMIYSLSKEYLNDSHSESKC